MENNVSCFIRFSSLENVLKFEKKFEIYYVNSLSWQDIYSSILKLINNGNFGISENEKFKKIILIGLNEIKEDEFLFNNSLEIFYYFEVPFEIENLIDAINKEVNSEISPDLLVKLLKIQIEDVLKGSFHVKTKDVSDNNLQRNGNYLTSKIEILVIEDNDEDYKEYFIEILKSLKDETKKLKISSEPEEKRFKTKKDFDDYMSKIIEKKNSDFNQIEFEGPNILCILLDLCIPFKENEPPLLCWGFAILDYLYKNYFKEFSIIIPLIFVSRYLDNEEIRNIIKERYPLWKDFYPKVFYLGTKSDNYFSLLMYIFKTHSIFQYWFFYNQIFEDKDKINIYNCLKERAKLDNIVVLDIWPEFLKSEQNNELNEKKLSSSILNEFSELEILILHKPTKEEFSQIKSNETEEFLIDYYINGDYLVNDYEKFEKLITENIKNIKIIYLSDLFYKAWSSSDIKNKFNFLYKIIEEEKLDPKLLDYLLTVGNPNEVFSLLTVGKRDKNDKWVIKPIPNLMFVRDIVSIIGDKIFLLNPAKQCRKREKHIWKFIFEKLYPENFIKPDFDETETIEGGDILLINSKSLLIGLSERTNVSAIKKFVEKVFDNVNSMEKVYVIPIAQLVPRSMHLDVFLGIVDDKTFVAYEGFIKKTHTVIKIIHTKDNSEQKKMSFSIEDITLEDILKDCSSDEKEIKIFEVKYQEFLEDGCNVLALSPQKVLVYAKNKDINYYLSEDEKKGEDKKEEQDKNKREVIKLDAPELVLARGGPHCLSLPFKRKKKDV